MTVKELINEVTDGFEGEFFPDTAYLVAEYNRIIRSLLLLLPTADASVLLPAYDGKIDIDLVPAQVRRVFFGEYELLKSSRALMALMPEARLYHAADDGIYVSVNGDCTVYYKSLPKEISEIEAGSEEIPLDARYIPIIRAWLVRSVHLYVGDFDGANAYGGEYNTLLGEFKRENGVAV